MRKHPSFEDLLFDPARSISEKEILSTFEVQEDLDLLLRALHCAYPAQWKMRTAGWEQITNRLNDLKEEAPSSSRSFGAALADILWDIPDGHLKVRLGTETLGKKIHQHRSQATTGTNIAREKVWTIELRQSAQGAIPVIGITWFPQPSEAPWEGFLEEIAKHTTAPAMIFDLRGNSGGNDSKAIDMTSLLLDRELVVDWVREIVCESAEAYALQINTYEKIIHQNYSKNRDQIPLELLQQITFLKEKALELKGHPPRKTIQQTPSTSQPLLGEKSFQGRIFILIDAKTQSSGEWSALYLQKHPRAQLVGENTFGMIHFGNSGYLCLPQSGLEITLCMKINEITDGRFFEKTGIPPNIPVSGEDSLEYTLKNLLK